MVEVAEQIPSLGKSNSIMIIIMIIIYIALFSYPFIALYNNQVNVEPKKLKNIIKYRDKLVRKLEIYIYTLYKK